MGGQADFTCLGCSFLFVVSKNIFHAACRNKDSFKLNASHGAASNHSTWTEPVISAGLCENVRTTEKEGEQQKVQELTHSFIHKLVSVVDKKGIQKRSALYFCSLPTLHTQG